MVLYDKDTIKLEFLKGRGFFLSMCQKFRESSLEMQKKTFIHVDFYLNISDDRGICRHFGKTGRERST